MGERGRPERGERGWDKRSSTEPQAGSANPSKHRHSSKGKSTRDKKRDSKRERESKASSPKGATTRDASRSRSRSRSGGGSDASSGPRRVPRPPIKYDHRRTEGEIRRCKKGKRTDIGPDEWEKFGYFDKESVLTEETEYKGNVVPIPRVKRKDITPQSFYEDYASKCKPVIIEDCLDDWPAMRRWSIEALEERFRNVSFKVAKTDSGKKLRTKFKYYADYLRHQRDDSPLYLFETSVDENGYIRALVDDYEVPDVFPNDWFSLINNDARPPFRWFCIGPKRSGTTVHTDPLGTNAWNAITHGLKRWVLMEPGEAKKKVKGKGLMKSGEDDEAIMYFDFVLPRIKKEYPEMKIYEGLQKPGEVIFVPGDWWHGVLNLEDTVAITQNYCGPENFDLVWKRARAEREKVAYLWLRNMRKFAPELHSRALAMNARDNFKMRHERPAGDRLPDADSSSSESSSDSSTDEAFDMDPAGMKDGLPKGSKLGAEAFTRQGHAPIPPIVSSAVAKLNRPGP